MRPGPITTGIGWANCTRGLPRSTATAPAPAPRRCSSGLGFADAEFERPVSSFSGGWRMRLNLAQALISRSDLLLLDEPTNHLDLDAVVWLEKWLTGYRGTLLLVSHDRDFLDACVTHIAHIYAQRLTLYTGNYTAFEEARAAQLAGQQAMYEKQQRTIEHLENYIRRFRAKATKARQAQSRLKALDRMEHIAAAHVDAPFDFEFPAPARAPDPLLTLEDVTAGYDGHTVLEGIKLTLRPGARMGLLGPNGAGKSTLIKLLSGELAPLSGQRFEGKGLAIGYFAQHQLEQLRPSESPLWHLVHQEPRTKEQLLRDYLGGFDFRGGMADAPIAPFSGGEKSRLALALLVRRRPNLMLLDEPTNHLDLDMRHALTKALAEYEGSMVLVSHDRALLRTVCDAFLLVVDGRAVEFDGDLDDYLEWLAARRSSQAAGNASAGQSVEKVSRKEERQVAAARAAGKVRPPPVAGQGSGEAGAADRGVAEGEAGPRCAARGSGDLRRSRCGEAQGSDDAAAGTRAADRAVRAALAGSACGAGGDERGVKVKSSNAKGAKVRKGKQSIDTKDTKDTKDTGHEGRSDFISIRLSGLSVLRAKRGLHKVTIQLSRRPSPSCARITPHCFYYIFLLLCPLCPLCHCFSGFQRVINSLTRVTGISRPGAGQMPRSIARLPSKMR